MREYGASAGRVLVVAGTRVARAHVGGHLRPRGFTVVEAADAVGALRAATEAPLDAILLDADHSEEDGLALLDELQENHAFQHVPVVFVSHRTGSDEVADGLRRGAHDYLRKPVEPAELVARVMAAVRMKALQDRLRAINDELRLTALTDSLTGLPNRRMAAEHLDRLLARARRHDRPFALVLADIDHFKAVNDAHGHGVGDLTLVAVARRLGNVCRRGDLLARWGGEELIVLSEQESAHGAASLAARLCDCLAAEPVQAGDLFLPVTISVGWSAWRPGDEADALLGRADRALYAAKAAGRGQVCSDEAAAA